MVHMEVVNVTEEIQGDNSFDETADDDTGRSRGASNDDGVPNGSSVDPL